MYKLDLEKAEEPEIKLPASVGLRKNLGNSKKSIHFCFIDYAKGFDYMGHNKLWKFLKRWEYQTTLLVSWETYKLVKKQLLEPDKEQTMVQNLERSMSRMYIVTQFI